MVTGVTNPDSEPLAYHDHDEHAEIWARLAAPFEAWEVRERSQAGRTFSYVTARAVMNRLDDVVGPSNWWDTYAMGENSVMCSLTLRLPGGATITKTDAGGYGGMPDQGDDEKAGCSDAFKRAAVKFGPGRYLYNDGVPAFIRTYFARCEVELAGSAAREPHRERPSPAPSPQTRQAPPSNPRDERQAPSNGTGRTNGNGGAPRTSEGVPRTGRALYAWTKSMEEKHGVGLQKYIDGWARLQELPARMVDYSADQVALAYAEGVRKLQTISSRDDSYEEALAN